MRKTVLVTVLSCLFILFLGGVMAVPWKGLTLYERWRELRTGTIYYSGGTRARVVALTFDDGPDPRYTPKVLAVLRKHHIHATFFVVGDMLKAHPALARQAFAEGHVLGNHTETHGHLELLRNPNAGKELDDCAAAIEKVTGQRTYLFRPPRGLWNREVFADARHDHYRTILWSLAFDRHAIRNPDVLARRVIRLARPGDIILMHDGSSHKYDERAATVRDLDAVITGLEKRGFKFVTVPQMLHISGDVPVPNALTTTARAARI